MITSTGLLWQDNNVSYRKLVPDTTCAVQKGTRSNMGGCVQGHGDAKGPMVSRQSSASSSVPERGTLRRTTEDTEAGGGGSSNASWDIFEPRVGTDANGAGTKSQSAPTSGAVTDLSTLKHMTGAPPQSVLSVAVCVLPSRWYFSVQEQRSGARLCLAPPKF